MGSAASMCAFIHRKELDPEQGLSCLGLPHAAVMGGTIEVLIPSTSECDYFWR